MVTVPVVVPVAVPVAVLTLGMVLIVTEVCSSVDTLCTAAGKLELTAVGAASLPPPPPQATSAMLLAAANAKPRRPAQANPNGRIR